MKKLILIVSALGVPLFSFAENNANLSNVEAITPGWWIAPIASVIALIFALIFYKWMMRSSEGNERMQEIAGHVKEGAMAYLSRQYKTVSLVFIILLIIFVILAYFGVQNPFVPIAFLTGGFFSGLCGFLGMKTATNASARTAQGASISLNKGLQVAFKSGAVMGLVVVGFGLLDISIWYFILDMFVYTPEHMANGFSFWGIELVHTGFDPVHKLSEMTTTMLTFGMGASTQALFARVGGGIYTKAADVGADLVGKVEAGIPEDDPRNPATIADNVGDNVGDVAGMGADLYESYCGSILATAALGAALPLTSKISGAVAVTAPMIVAGIGIILSILGMFMVKCKEGANMKSLLKALGMGTWGSSILIIIALAILTWGFDIIEPGIFGSIISGLVCGVIIGYFTEYYTSDEYKPTKGIAKQAEMGAATTIIDGFAVGMFSSGIPVITIAIGIICAFGFAGGFTDMSYGLYGIGFAAVGMLSTLGITLATDAYGPIADNAGGNAEMSGLDPKVRERTDALDMLGNTTAATGKGFAIGSAALTALALLAAFIMEVDIWSHKLGGKIGGFTTDAYKEAPNKILYFVNLYDVHIMNPMVICGLFIGAMMTFVFCAMTMKAVGRAAGSMVEEVRRQFREIPGIMEGTGTPDYARCVAISTKGAQKEMIVPSLLALIVPIITGLILGVPGVMGVLAGGLTTGFVLACTLNNAGGAWDNAKKHIEKGNLGGKNLKDGSKNPTHAAAVIGDTVGDPFKDTSGPSLNILIKLMSMVSIVFAPVIIKFSPMIQAWVGFK
jgi:K(+)-stimulated pyrophosphate-energized sodium pump